MQIGVTPNKRSSFKIQVNVSGKLLKDLFAYINAEYGPNERVLSLVVRKALTEFLERWEASKRS